jgi:hypothetical protein
MTAAAVSNQFGPVLPINIGAAGMPSFHQLGVIAPSAALNGHLGYSGVSFIPSRQNSRNAAIMAEMHRQNELNEMAFQEAALLPLNNRGFAGMPSFHQLGVIPPSAALNDHLGYSGASFIHSRQNSRNAAAMAEMHRQNEPNAMSFQEAASLPLNANLTALSEAHQRTNLAAAQFAALSQREAALRFQRGDRILAAMSGVNEAEVVGAPAVTLSQPNLVREVTRRPSAQGSEADMLRLNAMTNGISRNASMAGEEQIEAVRRLSGSNNAFQLSMMDPYFRFR